MPVRLATGGGETGGLWVRVSCAAAQGPRVWDALVGGGPGPFGVTAYESLRIEAGMPLFGHDVDERALLPEIPHERLVSYTKGCYPGQEVVVRIRDRGHVNRRLTGLVLESDVVPPHGADVLADGAAVGRVTSATWSLGLGRPVALGVVRRGRAGPARAGAAGGGQANGPPRTA